MKSLKGLMNNWFPENDISRGKAGGYTCEKQKQSGGDGTAPLCIAMHGELSGEEGYNGFMD